MIRFKRELVVILGLSLLAAALVYSIRTNPEWTGFDWALFSSSFRHVNWAWIAAGLAAVYATYVIRAIRWRILIRPIKRDCSLWNLLSATVVGFGAIAVVGRPGEFVRPYLIARKENIPVSGQLAAWVLERSFDTLILLASVAFAVAQFRPQSENSALAPQWWNSVALWVGLLSVAILALLIFLRNYYQPITQIVLGWLRFLPPARIFALKQAFEVFGEGLRSLRDGRSVFLCLAWSSAMWILIAAAYFAVLRASYSGVDFHFGQAVIFMGVAMAGSMFQVPGIGGGLQIASVLALTEVFGMQLELASSTAILIWFLTFLAVLPPALILLIHDGLSWAKLRELQSEA